MLQGGFVFNMVVMGEFSEGSLAQFDKLPVPGLKEIGVLQMFNRLPGASMPITVGKDS
jgi:hypothetical protein